MAHVGVSVTEQILPSPEVGTRGWGEDTTRRNVTVRPPSTVPNGESCIQTSGSKSVVLDGPPALVPPLLTAETGEVLVDESSDDVSITFAAIGIGNLRWSQVKNIGDVMSQTTHPDTAPGDPLEEDTGRRDDTLPGTPPVNDARSTVVGEDGTLDGAPRHVRVRRYNLVRRTSVWVKVVISGLRPCVHTLPSPLTLTDSNFCKFILRRQRRV